jgi:hypothetical protein
MTPVFTSLNLHEIHHFRNLLAAEGIETFIRNEMLSRLAGEVPFTECAPQLCVLNDADGPAAERVLAEFRRGVPKGPSWVCAQCGEQSERQFSACWQCGNHRPV